jgi:predicted pyridoxine 5'-phosphate oxidase superfamily flavin-nucleotide-binding protein
MTHAYGAIAFTPAVQAVQQEHGSRAAYARREGGATTNDRLGPEEVAFLAARDSFYMATVSATGWPYLQHRGGPPGFCRVTDERTIEFPDYAGNKQYISVGNLRGDDRVALFFMDYPNRSRLKLFGRAAALPAEGAAGPGRVERIVRIAVEGFDWNCPQHIVPRFTLEEIERAVAPLRARIAALEAERAGRTAAGGAAPASLHRAAGDPTEVTPDPTGRAG